MKSLLLLQDPASSIDVASPLIAAGWQVVKSTTQGLLKREQPERLHADFVGLLIFSSWQSFSPQEIAALPGSTTRQWVAVLPRAALRRAVLARAVLEHCHDYHTLPLDAPRLVATLGHLSGRRRLEREFQRSLAFAEAPGPTSLAGKWRELDDSLQALDRLVSADNARPHIAQARHVMRLLEHRLQACGALNEPIGGIPATLSEVRAWSETTRIRQSLADNSGNMAKTARSLGVSRVQLYRLLRRLGISLPSTNKSASRSPSRQPRSP